MLNGKPLAIELYAGSFGWSRGWLDLGGRAIGFDIEHLPHHGPVPAGAELVLQDCLTLHGSQFKDADIIFASSPCQAYSYLAMPWSRSPDWCEPSGDGWRVLNSAKAKEMLELWRRRGPDNRLFDACARIQREASEAAGRYIPMIQENVRGAQPWVGRSAWNFGSFHLWGDVPALMPINLRSGRKRPGIKLSDGFNYIMPDGAKGRVGGGWFGDGVNGDTRKSDPRDVRKMPDGSWETPDGTKIGGDWFRDPACHSKHGSRSNARKAASAQIARIPYALSRHIAEVYFPRSNYLPPRP